MTTSTGQLTLTCWVVERIREGRVPPAPVLRRWWQNPDMPPPRVHRRGRPATGTCQDCGSEFEMNPFGRPATRCAAHRRTTTPRQETP